MKKVYGNVQLDGTEVNYEIRFSHLAKRGSIRVREEGIIVTIPKYSAIKTAKEFIFEHKDWILKYLKKAEVVKKREPELFGNKVEVIINKHKVTEKYLNFTFKDYKLTVDCPEDTSLNNNELFETWLKAYAKRVLPKRVAALAEVHNLKFNRVVVKEHKSKWGSCSSKKNINLNYKLCKLDKILIDYIIIHELAHLVELNHSLKFWKVVEKMMPDYKLHEKAIRKIKLI